MKDLVKRLAVAGALAELIEETEASKDKSKMVVTFETENEAIAYAQRLATLKAGDVVKIPNEDNSGLRKVVYVGVYDASNGTMSFISWNSENKTFMTSCTSPALIHLD